ncbi:hypothetical protein [Pseudomonas syringae]|uniref:hypothetical protein n=1 Tax=Pseudomonas syringae TaxID=317 RepID=UPI0006CB8097|nr:hypothetical protein [Pseudomonas syringae]ALE01047.1 hypothetical protein PSYRMG_25290 [Pseudomonas syringae UMAF0158]MCK9731913.1 hypothetical protein [Pseudomonas syringae pv. syringae]
MEDLRPYIAERSTVAIGGVVTDKVTGEILGQYTNVAYAPEAGSVQYPEYRSKPRRAITLLDVSDVPDVTPFAELTKLDGVVDLDEYRARRGPKPKIFFNTIADLVQMAIADQQRWIDDYVYGACHTTGDVSNGTLNVSPGDVVRVCALPVISTATVKAIIRNHAFEPVSDRQARRIAQVAKFALGGMALYLDRNPSVTAALQFEVNFAQAYAVQQPITVSS